MGPTSTCGPGMNQRPSRCSVAAAGDPCPGRVWPSGGGPRPGGGDLSADVPKGGGTSAETHYLGPAVEHVASSSHPAKGIRHALPRGFGVGLGYHGMSGAESDLLFGHLRKEK